MGRCGPLPPSTSSTASRTTGTRPVHAGRRPVREAASLRPENPAAAGVLQRLLANGQFYRERIEYVGRGIHFYLYRRSALEPVERQPAPAGTGEGISTSRSSPWQAWVSHQGQRRAVLRSRARATDRGTRVRSLATRRRDGFGHRPRPTRCGRRCLMPPRRGQASRSDVVGNPQFAPDVSGA
jgi:hypothetical protein